MPEFTSAERILVKTIIATLSIKRIPVPEIIDEVFRQYHIRYMANVNDFDKYLPDFEQMVKSFEFPN